MLKVTDLLRGQASTVTKAWTFALVRPGRGSRPQASNVVVLNPYPGAYFIRTHGSGAPACPECSLSSGHPGTCILTRASTVRSQHNALLCCDCLVTLSVRNAGGTGLGPW